MWRRRITMAPAGFPSPTAMLKSKSGAMQIQSSRYAKSIRRLESISPRRMMCHGFNSGRAFVRENSKNESPVKTPFQLKAVEDSRSPRRFASQERKFGSANIKTPLRRLPPTRKHSGGSGEEL